MFYLETKQYKSFISLIEEIDIEERVQRDRGTLFELLVMTYFLNEPMYVRLFDRVWMLHNVPEEYSIPKKDTGVDLVARHRDTGKLVAIQCKYYSKDTTIQKSHIDSFLNEAGKKYYSEGIIVTSTDKWSKNADEALIGRTKPIVRIGLSELQESKVDWSAFSFANPKQVKLQDKKTPRTHQIPAIEAVVEGFETADRGKLIMAPGTGKTYASMVISEKLAEKKGNIFRVLYLVPSIQLLSQSLRGWTGDTNFEMDTIAVCSDRKVTKKTNGENELEDIAAADLGYPATTNYEKLLEYQTIIESKDTKGEILTVFSTYQSIDVIIEAQKNGFYDFDLVICDEAHRTTGATESGKEASSFVKVHSENNIKTKRRLYQTATPRVYGDTARQKADEMSVLIADMSDEEIYGKEFYRIGFGDAVNKGILTDYKVMVLAVDESVVQKRFQQMFSRETNELEFDDVTKIIGCWNGLIKRKNNSNELEGKPMKRAIAFSGTIRDSKLITKMFSDVVDQYINESGNQSESFRVEIDHADGSMNALQKNEKINWLKSDVPDQTCRILSNARFLTEGVDVPDLDAVIFLKPRKSKIDIAQAVGRVMRKVPGKDYGYVILPIGVPAGVDENSVLDNNEKYRVVWEVLNALRSLDERFDATINKLELNKNKPRKIQVIGVGDSPEDGYDGFVVNEDSEQIKLFSEEDWTELERAIYGKIVKKVGNVRYWEDWSKDVAIIAQQHITRINAMLEDKESFTYKEFCKFLSGLRHNINESISEQEVIEMLAQHMITKPVFDALFEQESFALNNPVSQAMDGMVIVLESLGLAREQEKLEGFYESVKVRAEGLDNLKAKQDIIVQLYDKFFKVGFPSTTERLGIVFTPTEVVDFIIHSVNDMLKKYFGKTISDKGVNILDPFTGTGTFITRLLQSGLVSKEDMLRKYTQELHANEIVLLSYYIAAINIEETYNSIMGLGEYLPFKGIVLTDTFESTEKEDIFDDVFFGKNDERLKRQKETPITIIMGNPPYSIGQTNENDDNQNNKYPNLDKDIANTYVKSSKAKAKNDSYNSYIRAFRWATNRIEKTGIVGFITGSGYIDKGSFDGVRHWLHRDYNYVYVLNLRGSIRGRIGDDAKKEGQNVFNILTGVSIIFLVKDGTKNHSIYYKDIGNYLSRDAKLNILSESKSILNTQCEELTPNDDNEWLNQSDPTYQNFYPLISDKKRIFNEVYTGIGTNRDNWVYNYSALKSKENAEYMIDNFNNEVDRLEFSNQKLLERNLSPSYVKWDDKLNRMLNLNKKINYIEQSSLVMYRPFTKKFLYYNEPIIHRQSKYQNMNPNNLLIYVTGPNARREFSAFITRFAPDAHLMDTGQSYSLMNLSAAVEKNLFNMNSNMSDEALAEFRMDEMSLLYYIYAIFHSKEYVSRFSGDLKKGSPKIPMLKNIHKFIEVGKQLVDLHLNYEDVDGYNNLNIEIKSIKPSYEVRKMKFDRIEKHSTIIFNSDISIKNIPDKAFQYIINGRSAIEWIIDQYQVKIDKKSGITDDPNEYSDDPKYIFNLLLSIINVSVQTVDLVDSLPPLDIVGD